jgi:SulP family sulfate permease
MRWFAPELEPKLVTLLREGYSRQQLLGDVLAGIVVGVVALPLAIAFAIASGVRPERGLYTAVVAGFTISALSGSRVQIGGPTGAFVVIVFGIVEHYGYDGLAVATLMAGAMLVLMGLARFGAVIRFIPYPVTVGFTSGIALIIAAGQLRDALGLALDKVPAGFGEKLVAYADHLGSIDGASIAVCLATIATVQLWPRLGTRVPGPLVALLLTTAVVQIFGLPVDSIGSRFGSVPSGLPAPRLPHFDWDRLAELVSPAVSIALLGGIESLLSAVVADGMTGRRHRSNAELVAQGVANMLSSIFGGIPATGAIARTATNVKNGGQTPVAGMVHALTLMAILVFAGSWAALIPMATLAGILLVVAYNMSEWRVFVRLLRGPRSDVSVLMATFLLTVLVDLTVAIQVGVVLAALLFMRRMAEVTQVRAITDGIGYSDEAGEEPTQRLDLPPGVEVFEINGSFCFGAAQKFSEVVAQTRTRPRAVILRMRHVMAIDATGMQALEEVAVRFARQGTILLLSGVHAQPLVAMERGGVLARIGEENLYASFADALARARLLIESAA